MSIAKEEVELIQVAAVATASLENMRYGQANAEAWLSEDCMACSDSERYDDHTCDPTMQAFAVLDDVFTERGSQDEKWGEQRHSRLEWAMILVEEIGEWAAEVPEGVVYEGLTPKEELMAEEILETLRRAGDGARLWLEGHEWEPRQQKVYDEEAGG